MGKVEMLKNYNDGTNYFKAGTIQDISSDLEKLFLEKNWAKKLNAPKIKKEEKSIDEISDDEILETLI